MNLFSESRQGLPKNSSSNSLSGRQQGMYGMAQLKDESILKYASMRNPSRFYPLSQGRLSDA